MSDQDIVIYTGSGVELSLPLDRERETVWASQAQIEDLFGVDQSGVSRHIRNIFRDAEVDRESTMQKVHIALPVDQGFAGQDVYPSVEEKAANLLYLVVKDPPLYDGNKRSAAALFVTFLARNGILYDSDGNLRITNSALAAITLMVAMSDPKEKELMIALLIRMITEGAS